MTDGGQGRGKRRRGGSRRTGGLRKPKQGEHRLGPPEPGLFAEIVLAPDREAVPDAHPVVSFREEDDRAYLTEVRRRKIAEIAQSYTWMIQVETATSKSRDDVHRCGLDRCSL